MNISRKWGLLAGAVVVSAGLLAGGAVYAAGQPDQPQNAAGAKVEQAEKATKLTPGEQEVLSKLKELRQSYRQKFDTDAKAILDQAVKEGKLTQAQADKLAMHGRHAGKHHMPKHMTQEQLKARLDQAVKSGKLTQEQADNMLKRWSEKQSTKQ